MFEHLLRPSLEGGCLVSGNRQYKRARRAFGGSRVPGEPMSRRTHPNGRAWPKRRQWLDRISTDTRLTHGCKAWLLQLAKRSDDLGKPVWGSQVKMAAELGRCDRSVRRYRFEAEQLGYVLVFRSKPQRGADGRFCRRKANSYYLCLPGKAKAAQTAPRRRQRAPYCVVRRHREAVSAEPLRVDDLATQATQDLVPVTAATTGDPLDLADTDDRSTPLTGVRQPSPHPTVSNPQGLHHPNPPGIAAARAALAACKQPTPPPKSHPNKF